LALVSDNLTSAGQTPKVTVQPYTMFLPVLTH
jgi:hypothetical protein